MCLVGPGGCICVRQMTWEGRRVEVGGSVTLGRDFRGISLLCLVLPEFFFGKFFWGEINVTCHCFYLDSHF